MEKIIRLRLRAIEAVLQLIEENSALGSFVPPEIIERETERRLEQLLHPAINVAVPLVGSNRRKHYFRRTHGINAGRPKSARPRDECPAQKHHHRGIGKSRQLPTQETQSVPTQETQSVPTQETQSVPTQETQS